jgi:hypothetical protein
MVEYRVSDVTPVVAQVGDVARRVRNLHAPLTPCRFVLRSAPNSGSKDHERIERHLVSGTRSRTKARNPSVRDAEERERHPDASRITGCRRE